jgi:hypothetical protein
MAFGLISSNDPQNMANEMNKNILELKNNEVVQYFKDDTGTRRVMMGKGPDGFYGLKVSQEGNDVYTATNDQLVFNSDNNVFKIVLSGIAVVNYAASAGQAETTVAHNLGFVPAGMVYLIPDNAAYYQPTPLVVTDISTGAVLQEFDWYVDDTNLTLRFTKNNVAGSGYASASTASYKYFLFQETAN